MHQGIPSGFKQNMMIMAFIEHWERLKWPSSISPWHIILDGMQPLASWIESLRPIRVLRRSQRKYRSDGLWWLATEDHVYCLFCLLQKLRVPFIAVLVSESARDPFHPTILILHQYATVFSFRRTALLALWHSTGRMRFGHLRIGDELPGLFLDVSTVGHCGATGRLAPSQSEAGTPGTGSYNGESEVSKTIPGERRTGRVGRAMQGRLLFLHVEEQVHASLTLNQATCKWINVHLRLDHYWSLLIYNTDNTIQYWHTCYHYLPHHLLTYNWHTKPNMTGWLGQLSWSSAAKPQVLSWCAWPAMQFRPLWSYWPGPWPLGSQHVL